MIKLCKKTDVNRLLKFCSGRNCYGHDNMITHLSDKTNKLNKSKSL